MCVRLFFCFYDFSILFWTVLTVFIYFALHFIMNLTFYFSSVLDGKWDDYKRNKKWARHQSRILNHIKPVFFNSGRNYRFVPGKINAYIIYMLIWVDVRISNICKIVGTKFDFWLRILLNYPWCMAVCEIFIFISIFAWYCMLNRLDK